jgi:hypothetical protein
MLVCSLWDLFMGREARNGVYGDQIGAMDACSRGVGLTDAGIGAALVPHRALGAGRVFSTRGRSIPSVSGFRDDLLVLILRARNVPGSGIADFTGFGKSSPSIAAESRH